MKLPGPLLVVRDLSVSRRFYEQVLGQKVTLDFGANIVFDGGFSLQTAKSWAWFIHKSACEIRFGANDAELYFETEDFDGFAARLEGLDGIRFLHRETEHAWGQRVGRFYDPDDHIIEVGEAMHAVVSRFLGRE